MSDLLTLFNQIIELPESARSNVMSLARESQGTKVAQQPAALAAVLAKSAPAVPYSVQRPSGDMQTEVRSMGGKLGALQREIQ